MQLCCSVHLEQYQHWPEKGLNVVVSSDSSNTLLCTCRTCATLPVVMATGCLSGMLMTAHTYCVMVVPGLGLLFCASRSMVVRLPGEAAV